MAAAGVGGTNTTVVDVLVIGAGAAGLTAAYDLTRQNVSFQILEAASFLGGRLKKVESANFATSFPIDAGGEWIHVDPRILNTIVNDDDGVEETIHVETFPFKPMFSYRDGGEWAEEPWFLDNDHKFKGYTWFDFFNDFIAIDEVTSKITYDCQATNVDTISTTTTIANNASKTVPEQDTVAMVTCADGRQWTATHAVIVTVPLKALQDNVITFTPTLPSATSNAIARIEWASGIKVFLKFTTKFYRDAFSLENNSVGGDERFFYNAAIGQDTHDEHILGVFLMGPQADAYVDLSDDEIVAILLADLDTAYGNVIATSSLISSHVQNWNRQPFIGGAYTASARERDINTLREVVVENTIVFAGEAIPDDGNSYQWGFVHGAALSGRRAANLAIGMINGTENGVGSSRLSLLVYLILGWLMM